HYYPAQGVAPDSVRMRSFRPFGAWRLCGGFSLAPFTAKTERHGESSVTIRYGGALRSDEMSATLTFLSRGVLRYSRWDALLIALSLGHAAVLLLAPRRSRSEEHTSELQSRFDLVCR